ncbi:MAG: hypothetical protein QGG40_20410, partial [Myxococcota bacterium]|nr:hypothetical protein [Myxococcota bacterium]
SAADTCYEATILGVAPESDAQVCARVSESVLRDSCYLRVSDRIGARQGDLPAVVATCQQAGKLMGPCSSHMVEKRIRFHAKRATIYDFGADVQKMLELWPGLSEIRPFGTAVAKGRRALGYGEPVTALCDRLGSVAGAGCRYTTTSEQRYEWADRPPVDRQLRVLRDKWKQQDAAPR